MADYYFAYGSNMLIARLQARVSSAHALGLAVLHGHRIAWHKRGSDGSGKLDICAHASGQVEGMLFRLSESHWQILDDIEGPGYERCTLEVRQGDMPVMAQCYRALDIHEEAVPYDWYKALCLAGCMETGCSQTQLMALSGMPSQTDPDHTRRTRLQALEILVADAWHEHPLINSFLKTSRDP